MKQGRIIFRPKLKQNEPICSLFFSLTELRKYWGGCRHAVKSYGRYIFPGSAPLRLAKGFITTSV